MTTNKQPSFNPDRFRKQLSVMLRMQDEMNKIVFPDWRERGLGWHRAIYVEAVEFLDHLGQWKWWKKGTPDLPQAQIELVDIMHFGMSLYMNNMNLPSDSEVLIDLMMCEVSEVASVYDNPIEMTPDERHVLVDNFINRASAREFYLPGFVAIMAQTGLSLDDLYVGYVGKNMLNRFRQDNGYKTGEYVKTWNGREDNEVLHDIMQGLPNDENLPTAVYSALQEAYNEVKPVKKTSPAL